MSDIKKDGGPAYPIPCQFDVSCGPRFESGYGGMSLRDYFAAKALPVVWSDIPDDANRAQALLYLGLHAYEMADAMLEARGK